MLRDRYRIILIVAVIVASGSAWGVYRILGNMRASNRVVTRMVVVAAKDITEGAALTSDALTLAELPIAAIPAGAFSAADSVVERVARVSIFKGEAIVPGRLAPAGTTAGIEVKISPGKRAMAVRIDDVTGLSGLMQPNSRVDVLVTLRDEENASGRISKLFMSNMRVLSVGAQVERGADGQAITAASAMLEVTPDEAERLAVAMREGSIQLVLRGYGDPDSIRTNGARPSDVLRQLRSGVMPETTRREPEPVASRPRNRAVAAPVVPAPAVTTPAPTPRPVPVVNDSVTVKIYRGDRLSQQKFESRKDSVRRDTL
ncbi:MAG: Flp pilus assembly protein CpaB [Gemmatimonadota bacterium]|nr:Flp pilus assembly protein CpaB [Gemmatimonadota bacterium]MDQ8167892.1 Flp pilus assembly protein CpaB [Gemmatimonadota bacterium]MDQ8173778.1 Flp pilus assembly protein CpaB [Gemmatimonadota bacterium]